MREAGSEAELVLGGEGSEAGKDLFFAKGAEYGLQMGSATMTRDCIANGRKVGRWFLGVLSSCRCKCSINPGVIPSSCD